MSVGSHILAVLKRHFLSGVLVVVPIILTYIVIKFLFTAVDSVLQPLLLKLLGYYIPGLGFITTLALIFLAGFFTRNLLGARLYRAGDRILTRLPIIRPIYSAAKQLLEAVTVPSVASFKEVALIEYPRRGIYALSFITNRVTLGVDNGDKKYTTVFVPSTPTPISGMVIILPSEEVILLDMTVEDGIKFLVSGGVASPETLMCRESKNSNADDEVTNETR